MLKTTLIRHYVWIRKNMAKNLIFLFFIDNNTKNSYNALMDKNTAQNIIILLLRATYISMDIFYKSTLGEII